MMPLLLTCYMLHPHLPPPPMNVNVNKTFSGRRTDGLPRLLAAQRLMSLLMDFINIITSLVAAKQLVLPISSNIKTAVFKMEFMGFAEATLALIRKNNNRQRKD